MDMQNVSNLQIPEGVVRTIHDKDNRLIWGRVAYNTKYAGDTIQQTYSGKNLLNLSGKTTTVGITGTVVDGSTVTVTGTTSSTGGYEIASKGSPFNIPAGTYTLCVDKASSHVINLVLSYSGGNTSFRLTAGQTSATNTLGGDATEAQLYWAMTSGVTYNETIKFQLVSGSTPDYDFEPYVGGVPAPNPDYPQDVQVVTGEQTVTIGDGVSSEDFSISLGSIELCKIGDYQDYIYKSGDDWYVHKAVRHLQLPISGMDNSDSNPGWMGQTQLKTDLGTASGGQIYTDTTMATNIAGLVTSESRSVTKNFNGNNALLLLPTSYYGNDHTQTYWKTNYADLVVDFYYGINGAITDTKITDATLVGQLNAVHEWLTRYGYNATVNGNLPIIIDRTNL